jgi:hypothetical protein
MRGSLNIHFAAVSTASKLHEQLDVSGTVKQGNSQGGVNFTGLGLCESKCDSLGYMENQK